MVTISEHLSIDGFDGFAEALRRSRTGESGDQSNARQRCVGAATLAMRDGGCDQLVAAALAHDIASVVEPATAESNGPSDSALLLGGIFPPRVIAWLEEVDANAMSTGRVEGSAGGRSHVARLRRYIEVARSVRQHAVMPVELLVAAARRASLDD